MSARITYDISIWEEIRSIVQWKTDRLVGNINKAIPKDLSLAEFQSKQPVPWQLGEIMEQRANAWVQSVYDICCNAQKDSGKALSEDFDRAVWAYWIEPFIMGEKRSASYNYTISRLLDLLFCAVGSPPEKRDSLKVSQRECCLAIRLKVYETWHDKLLHRTPRINEAVAAMAAYNAQEARAVRIVAGLSPEPPPPPTPTLPLAQAAASGPPQTAPVPLSATVPASPPLRPVQEGSVTEPPGGTESDMPTQSSDAGVATWDTIELLFLSDERVQIRNGTNTETRNYGELGFADARDGKPNQAWVTLRALAEERGTIRDAAKTGRAWLKVEKRMQEIRKALRKHFGISADPVPYVDGTGYRACFKIGCGPSFHT